MPFFLMQTHSPFGRIQIHINKRFPSSPVRKSVEKHIHETSNYNHSQIDIKDYLKNQVKGITLSDVISTAIGIVGL